MGSLPLLPAINVLTSTKAPNHIIILMSMWFFYVLLTSSMCHFKLLFVYNLSCPKPIRQYGVGHVLTKPRGAERQPQPCPLSLSWGSSEGMSPVLTVLSSGLSINVGCPWVTFKRVWPLPLPWFWVSRQSVRSLLPRGLSPGVCKAVLRPLKMPNGVKFPQVTFVTLETLICGVEMGDTLSPKPGLHHPLWVPGWHCLCPGSYKVLKEAAVICSLQPLLKIHLQQYKNAQAEG